MAGVSIYVVSAIWALASAVALVAVGVVALLGGRARPRGALAFGAFSVVWGIQIVVGNAATLVSSPGAAETLYLLSLVALLVLPFLLLEFAVAQSATAGALWRAMRAGAAVAAMAAALVLVLVPGLLHQGVVLRGEHYYPLRGPLHVYLVQAPLFLAFGAALVSLQLSKERAATPRIAQRAWILLAGLGLYVAHAAGTYLVQFGLLPLFFPGTPVNLESAFWALLFTTLSLLVLWVGARNLAAARSATDPAAARADRLAAAAAFVPFALGVTEGILVLTTMPNLQTVGLWRLLGLSIIAYGIARWRIYDLPQRAGSAAATAGGAAAAVATGAGAFGVASALSTSGGVPVVTALLVLAAALLPSVNFARRLFGVSTGQPRAALEESLYGQRIDSYRAALEASLARDTLDEDEAFLAALRERFGISPDEHRVLMHLARSSVIVAHDRRASDAYERLRLLGEGGGGRTWLARDRARDRLVVLKEPLERWQQEPTAREAVLREARLAAKVRHPHVVSVEQVVEGKASPIIVMEYLDGGSLRDALRQRGTLPWGEARALMLDVLRGVEAIHAGGIVHRDIKPSNILLTSDGVPKVADFGVAVPQTSAQTVVMDPAATHIAGTLAYMAPEMRSGVSSGDRRADVYGCAAVLHECLYGAPPGAHAPVVVRQDLPAALQAVLAKGLAERPEARYPTARAFAEDLARVA